MATSIFQIAVNRYFQSDIAYQCIIHKFHSSVWCWLFYRNKLIKKYITKHYIGDDNEM